MKKTVEIKICDICKKEIDEFCTPRAHSGRLIVYTVTKEVYYQGKFKMSLEICEECYDKIQKKLDAILKDIPFNEKIS